MQMGKKNREKKVKTPPELLSKEERETRVEKLYDLFKQYDAWAPEKYPAQKQFETVCQEYIENGESVDGKIRFPELNKNIYYIISNKKRTEPTLHLLHIG